MIVRDDQVEAALEYLALDPHPEAVAKMRLTKAENAVEQALCDGILASDARSSAERVNWAKTQPDYKQAKEAEANLMLDYINEKARIRNATFVIEAWRTQNANARAAERLR